MENNKNDNFGYKPDESKKLERGGIHTTYIGSSKWQCLETGEIKEFEFVNKEVKHTLKGGWRRVYLEQFMEILTGLYSSGRKIDVVEFILNNLNSDNQFTMTQKSINKKTGIALQTINDTFKFLTSEEINFMKKIDSVYQVNTKYICAFGSDAKNKILAIKYQNAEPQLFTEQELQNQKINDETA